MITLDLTEIRVLGVDLGGTKVAFALFSGGGEMISSSTVLLEKRTGMDVCNIINDGIARYILENERDGKKINAIGISVPGIFHKKTGRVWAPNIAGWEDFPLLEEVKKASGKIPVFTDNDRACSMFGEMWQGAAKGCVNAVFLAVGTGIGAGILVNGEILRGNSDIAGATGWMALNFPYLEKYRQCGCFEYYASGGGIPLVARELAGEFKYYHGDLAADGIKDLTAKDVFAACDEGDPVARRVIDQCIQFWGMAAANFISIFNPSKVIFGGGLFGPAAAYIEEIRKEAGKWSQPISFAEASIEVTTLGPAACVHGAAWMAIKNLIKKPDEL